MVCVPVGTVIDAQLSPTCLSYFLALYIDLFFTTGSPPYHNLLSFCLIDLIGL